MAKKKLLKNKKVYKTLYIVISFLIVAVGIVVVVGMFNKAQAVKQSEDFLRKIDKNETNQSYSKFSDMKKNGLSEESFALNLKIQRQPLGGLNERTIVETDREKYNNKNCWKLTFDSKFSSGGKAKEIILIAKENNEWKVVDYQLKSNTSIRY